MFYGSPQLYLFTSRGRLHGRRWRLREQVVERSDAAIMTLNDVAVTCLELTLSKEIQL